MNDTQFKQIALNKLDLIYKLKESMDEWLEFWAEHECPVKIGDEYPVWVHSDIALPMIVSKITAKLIPDHKFVWYVEGWVTLFKFKELHNATFEMEEDNEI